LLGILDGEGGDDAGAPGMRLKERQTDLVDLIRPAPIPALGSEGDQHPISKGIIQRVPVNHARPEGQRFFRQRTKRRRRETNPPAGRKKGDAGAERFRLGSVAFIDDDEPCATSKRQKLRRQGQRGRIAGYDDG
jgi:hypothetical protein